MKGSGNYLNYRYRGHDPRTGRFPCIDPLAAKYPHNSPYAFSENRVIDGVELEGLEWKPVKNDAGEYVDFEWDPDNAWIGTGTNKKLREGYYRQAIMFHDLNTYDPESNFNMGSAIANVYKVDGSTEQLESSTLPAEISKHAVVQEKLLYEAKWGTHKGKGPALNVRYNGKNKIPIEQEIHPSFPKQFDEEIGAYATDINIHWGYSGWDQATNSAAITTGYDSRGNACSIGCILVDGLYKDYQKNFISQLNQDYEVGMIIVRPYYDGKNFGAKSVKSEPNLTFDNPYIQDTHNTLQENNGSQ